ncbi:MAG TPA: hypothetical protein VH256_03645 [Thermoleophilaceae bacterium]|nr:hypothetical protein [Thermoleophilaceae bacterium]
MARRSLKPQLNQIRTWARQGRTDAWIAHQLEVSVSDIRGFKRDHGLSEPNGEAEPGPAGAGTEEELDLRAEDDALVAAALEEEDEEEETVDSPQSTEAQDEADDEAPKPRRRGRRGGRGRGRGGKRPLEGTFDHGDEGYGLWLDPAVQDDPVYAEHWAGHRPVTVTVEAERIVIRRAGEEASGGDDS